MFQNALHKLAVGETEHFPFNFRPRSASDARCFKHLSIFGAEMTAKKYFSKVVA